MKAVDYLLNVNRGYRMDLGRRVVVIGGGFVAFDAARTALRVFKEEELDALAGDAGAADARAKEALDSARAALRGGAADVTIVSLENFDEMPVLRTMQGHEEFEEAKREGIVFLPRRGPEALPRDVAPRGRRAQEGPLRLRRERPLLPALRRRRRDDAPGRRLHPRRRSEARPLVPRARGRRRPDARRDDPGRRGDARDLRAAASTPAATSRSGRGT